MRAALLLVLIPLAVQASGGLQATACPGCPIEVDELTESDKRIVDFAMAQLETGSNNFYARKVVKVKDFKRQVVAGIKYIFTLELVDTECQKTEQLTSCEAPNTPTENCTVSVWERTWLNSRIFNWDDVECSRHENTKVLSATYGYTNLEEVLADVKVGAYPYEEAKTSPGFQFYFHGEQEVANKNVVPLSNNFNLAQLGEFANELDISHQDEEWIKKIGQDFTKKLYAGKSFTKNFKRGKEFTKLEKRQGVEYINIVQESKVKPVITNEIGDESTKNINTGEDYIKNSEVSREELINFDTGDEFTFNLDNGQQGQDIVNNLDIGDEISFTPNIGQEEKELENYLVGDQQVQEIKVEERETFPICRSCHLVTPNEDQAKNSEISQEELINSFDTGDFTFNLDNGRQGQVIVNNLGIGDEISFTANIGQEEKELDDLTFNLDNGRQGQVIVNNLDIGDEISLENYLVDDQQVQEIKVEESETFPNCRTCHLGTANEDQAKVDFKIQENVIRLEILKDDSYDDATWEAVVEQKCKSCNFVIGKPTIEKLIDQDEDIATNLDIDFAENDVNQHLEELSHKFDMGDEFTYSRGNDQIAVEEVAVNFGNDQRGLDVGNPQPLIETISKDYDEFTIDETNKKNWESTEKPVCRSCYLLIE